MRALQTEGVFYYALGALLPLSGRCTFGDGGRTDHDSPENDLPAVAVASHTQGYHSVQSGLFSFGQMLPQVRRMGTVGRKRIAGA